MTLRFGEAKWPPIRTELVHTIDRDSDQPLWRQIQISLSQRIAGGEFEDSFPTEHQLLAEYGVSRHTVREALRSIEAQGLLHRTPGRGTSVVAREFTQPLGSLYSLFQTLSSQGDSHSSTIIVAESTVNSRVAPLIGLGPDDPVLFIERLRMAGGEPIAIDRVWLPNEFADVLLTSDLEGSSIHNEISSHMQLMPIRGREVIKTVVPSEEEAARLKLPPGDAAFRIERSTEYLGGSLEWRESLVRGDRYAFSADWNTSGAPAATQLEPLK